VLVNETLEPLRGLRKIVLGLAGGTLPVVGLAEAETVTFTTAGVALAQREVTIVQLSRRKASDEIQSVNDPLGESHAYSSTLC
jgi:hypothetical protein